MIDRGTRRTARGSATVAALMAVVVLLGLTVGILSVTLGSRNERRATETANESLTIADAALSHAIANLLVEEDGDVGSPDDPLPFSGGTYWASVVENGDETYTVTTFGTSSGVTSSIEAVVRPESLGVFDYALFAGNEDGDPLYTMDFGGEGAQADQVMGDVHSGGDLLVEGDASLQGELSAQGQVIGASGTAGVTQPIPDLAAMDYANTADFDVAELFANDPALKYKYHPKGGSAWTVPPSNPAHVFRLNPSDRQAECQSTVKDDWFLEDLLGSNPKTITLTAPSGEGVPNGNDAVYYIDGNLWLHNLHTLTLQLQHNDDEGVQVTFVVEGNIYFGDDFLYDDVETDGVAFIAMEDPDVADSGNVYFGDPSFGTLSEMHGFIYAQNDFYDNNLDADGSSQVEVYGIMSAGNQVQINRDWGDQHSRLTVQYDDRVAEGEVEIPGLPAMMTGTGVTSVSVLSWRRVGLP